MTRRAHDTWSRSSKSSAPRGYSSRGNYSEWERRDTRGASSSGYEDKRAGWSNARATEVDADKNKDKDDASRTGKEKEAEKGQEKEKEKEKEKEREK